MFIDRTIQPMEADAYSTGPAIPLAAQRGRTSPSKWAQSSVESPHVAIATIVIFIMTSLLATATFAQAIVRLVEGCMVRNS